MIVRINKFESWLIHNHKIMITTTQNYSFPLPSFEVIQRDILVEVDIKYKLDYKRYLADNYLAISYDH